MRLSTGADDVATGMARSGSSRRRVRGHIGQVLVEDDVGLTRSGGQRRLDRRDGPGPASLIVRASTTPSAPTDDDIAESPSTAGCSSLRPGPGAIEGATTFVRRPRDVRRSGGDLTGNRMRGRGNSPSRSAITNRTSVERERPAPRSNVPSGDRRRPPGGPAAIWQGGSAMGCARG